MRSSDSVIPSPKSGPPAQRTRLSSDLRAHDASDTLRRSSRMVSICVFTFRLGSTSTTRSRAGSWSTISPATASARPAAAGSRKSQATPSRNSVRLRATGSVAPLTNTSLSTRNGSRPAGSAWHTGGHAAAWASSTARPAAPATVHADRLVRRQSATGIGWLPSGSTRRLRRVAAGR
ncbi:MAG: hypothetical protein EBX36_03055 [Planctomycetia bacterium]|nr:hypothetical protein [Planctomycetia bacterium]